LRAEPSVRKVGGEIPDRGTQRPQVMGFRKKKKSQMKGYIHGTEKKEHPKRSEKKTMPHVFSGGKCQVPWGTRSRGGENRRIAKKENLGKKGKKKIPQLAITKQRG